mmetsp:Transcript_58539/g.120932  ORF Transcript_58539/g.120932 Transcript_58539/m.120932 type:complete len:87 (-) Transcript_58539:703-963(-)
MQPLAKCLTSTRKAHVLHTSPPEPSEERLSLIHARLLAGFTTRAAERADLKCHMWVLKKHQETNCTNTLPSESSSVTTRLKWNSRC